MFIEFTVGNYRSFKEPVTLSMVAAKLTARDKRLDENNVISVPGGPDLLSSAAIYGANASGKTNLVAAFSFMRAFVLGWPRSTAATGIANLEPFRLSTETAGKPSRFEMVFFAGGRCYRYGFEADARRVVGEWLYHVPRIREARLFERHDDEIVLGEGFREGKGLQSKTRPNALFLSVAAQFNGMIAQRIEGWFRDSLQVVSGLNDYTLREYTEEAFLGGEHRQEIIELVRHLDLGISDLEIERRKAPNELYLPEEVRAQVRERGEWLGTHDETTVQTLHPRYDAAGRVLGDERFDLDLQESEGTRKLFALSGLLVEILETGGALVVDELDARLHPLITRAIIDLFNSKEGNPRGAQLVFTTQDTNLLDKDIFRRDQIWFTEKDRVGATHLYSLAEFRGVRNDASFGKDYISGRYGAIPYLGDLSRLLGESDA